ncbi:MAG: ABC transporter substrate-binding protein, partial [Bacteroidota bacterium]|nr:ABC transporter substrate-binding protein [Bacteroidota bacterium]
RYKQKLEDVQAWLKQTQWTQNRISKDNLDRVQSTLLDKKLIAVELKHSKLFFDLNYIVQ